MMLSRRMVSSSSTSTRIPPSSSPRSADRLTPQLSKEDEEASHGEETEVRREDQEKINRFSRLHQRETALQEQLKTKQIDEEVSKIEGQLGELRDELQQLKVALYARFGRSINLET
ncbi:hypothetical protein CISG_00451 [Coccidioides immitis RMSCC 3703]|uniref:Uncharacterized protein n=1 Tax=Coccidioides immitis RMSCC 3703 TaxID=454286 RepID=A0A0J8TEZ1_COCIT|nr:hypothetical protein CISG_00451 [Coccidioides immitis RMSCC 3703]